METLLYDHQVSIVQPLSFLPGHLFTEICTTCLAAISRFSWKRQSGVWGTIGDQVVLSYYRGLYTKLRYN
uniref:Uncharacterized protein n=1 Tax=Aegilops tauschii subsp. strangulata TaxID=200361 RepID=A0A453QTX3_AEGTS